MSLLAAMTVDASGNLKPVPGTALAFQTYLALASSGTHAADAQKMLSVLGSPISSPQAIARANEIRARTQRAQPARAGIPEKLNDDTAAEQEESERRDRITELQNQIDELEESAASWDGAAESDANNGSNCQNTGAYTGLCNSIGNSIGT